MYPENQNSHKGRNIAIGIIVGLIFCGLFAGCIAVVAQFIKLSDNGKLDRYLAENDDDYEDSSDFGYYDEDGNFHYYGDEGNEWEEDGFGYYDEDGEFHYYGEEEDPRDIFDHSTHEDYEGYDTGEYFSMPADNRVDGLSYTVEMEETEYYDKDVEDTYFYYSYAVVEGDVPNKDYINDEISAEWEDLLTFYEEDYKPYMEDDYYIKAELECNVAYMTEDILSIVYQESVYYYESSDYPVREFYLCSLNFDMKNGRLLENTGMLDVNEKFVEDFEERSERQNGDSVLDYYDEEELIEMFQDDFNLILFYCPQGMEIGINVDEGWVTVTYPDYEEYLKKM